MGSLPNFKDFKENTNQAYQYAMVLAVVALFGFLTYSVKKHEEYLKKEKEISKELLDRCIETSLEKDIKIEKLSEKMVDIALKQNKINGL